MEVFFFVVLVILIVVLITRAEAEEVENKKKEVRKKNESRLQSLKEEKKRQQGLKKNIDASEEFINQLVEIIEENKYGLLEERRKLVKKDSYGKEETSRWVGNPTLSPSSIELGFLINDLGDDGFSDFKKGIPYFWFSVILPAIGGTSKPEKNSKIFFNLLFFKLTS